MSYGLDIQDENGNTLFDVNEGRWLVLKTGFIFKGSTVYEEILKSNYPGFTYFNLFVNSYSYKDIKSGAKTSYHVWSSDKVAIYGNNTDVNEYYIFLGR